MTLCYFLPINPPVILSIILPVIAPNLGITGRITGEIMGRIIVLLTCTPWYFQYHATHFLDENEWYKVRLWLFSSADACENHSPSLSTIVVVLIHPFFRPCIWSLKNGGQTLRLTGGLCPKTKHVHWGSVHIAGACHLFRFSVFPFFAGRSSW